LATPALPADGLRSCLRLRARQPVCRRQGAHQHGERAPARPARFSGVDASNSTAAGAP
jgi:hypothetical protein